MATLGEIRDAIKETLSTIADVRIYDTVPDQVNLPAILILPVEANFDKAFGRGHDEWQFDLFVMTSRTVARTSQDSLDAFVNGSGTRSIRALIFANQTLGLNDGTQAHVSGMSRYGGEFKTAGQDHIGAALRLTVTTIGTA
jgi:hypothetical protein